MIPGVSIGDYISVTDDDGNAAAGRVVSFDEDGDMVIDTAAEPTESERKGLPQNACGTMKIYCYRCTREVSFDALSESIADIMAAEAGWLFMGNRAVCPRCKRRAA